MVANIIKFFIVITIMKEN